MINDQYGGLGCARVEKPPLGLIPRKLCVEQRLKDILDAITRYRDGHYIIPAEWFDEAADISRWLEKNQNTP